MTIPPYEVPIRIPIRSLIPDVRQARFDPTGRRRMLGKCSVLDREGYCRGCEQDALGTITEPRHRKDVEAVA